MKSKPIFFKKIPLKFLQCAAFSLWAIVQNFADFRAFLCMPSAGPSIPPGKDQSKQNAFISNCLSWSHLVCTWKFSEEKIWIFIQRYSLKFNLSQTKRRNIMAPSTAIPMNSLNNFFFGSTFHLFNILTHLSALFMLSFIELSIALLLFFCWCTSISPKP